MVLKSLRLLCEPRRLCGEEITDNVNRRVAEVRREGAEKTKNYRSLKLSICNFSDLRFIRVHLRLKIALVTGNSFEES